MSAILHYFTGRGKAEIIRLTMAATGIKWTSVNYTEQEKFEKIKAEGRLLFQQLPMVEFEGKDMVQSSSIARYFGRRGNILGDNSDEMLRVDILFEGTRDFLVFFLRYGFEGWKDVLDAAKTKAMTRYMPIFEKELQKNGSNGHLVGNKLTLADIGLLEVILIINELLGANELEPYPNIQKFFGTIKSTPAISSYLAGPMRPRAMDERYVNEVKRVLNW